MSSSAQLLASLEAAGGNSEAWRSSVLEQWTLSFGVEGRHIEEFTKLVDEVSSLPRRRRWVGCR